jgi:hypothetical protein
MNWETLVPLAVAIPFAILPGFLAIAGLAWGIYVALRAEVREKRRTHTASQAEIAKEPVLH